MLLHCQLQEGLRYNLMKAQPSLVPRGTVNSVSRQGMRRSGLPSWANDANTGSSLQPPLNGRTGAGESATLPTDGARPPSEAQASAGGLRRCFKCGNLARNCATRRTENQVTEGPTAKNPNTRQGTARQVNTTSSGEPPLEWIHNCWNASTHQTQRRLREQFAK